VRGELRSGAYLHLSLVCVGLLSFSTVYYTSRSLSIALSKPARFFTSPDHRPRSPECDWLAFT